MSADACSTDLCIVPTCSLCESNFGDAFRTSYDSKEECRAYECHKCGACPVHFDDWHYFPNTFYTDDAECEAVECDICSKCQTNFRNGFELEYNSVFECQEAHCDAHESCQLCYSEWQTAFRTHYESPAHCASEVCNHCGECEANWEDNDYFLPAANNATHCVQQFCHKCSVCHSDDWDTQMMPDNSRMYSTSLECKAHECFVESAESCVQYEIAGYTSGLDYTEAGLRALTNRIRGAYVDQASCEAIEKDGCKACPQWMIHFEDVYFSQAQCEEDLCHICSDCASLFDLNFLEKYDSPSHCQATECTDWTCDLCDTHTETTPVVNPMAGNFIPFYDGATLEIAMQKREIVFFSSKSECLSELCYQPKCSDCEFNFATAFKTAYADVDTCTDQAFCHNIANCIDDFATAFEPQNTYSDVEECVDAEAIWNADPADANCLEGPCLVCSHCESSWDQMVDDTQYTAFASLTECLTKYCEPLADQVCSECLDPALFNTKFYEIYSSKQECFDKAHVCHQCSECASNSGDQAYFATMGFYTTSVPTGTSTAALSTTTTLPTTNDQYQN